jgi:hypothetical protein
MAPCRAFAERGALTAEMAMGGTLTGVRLPVASTAPLAWGSAMRFGLGLRYALAHEFELGATASYEPPLPWSHRDSRDRVLQHHRSEASLLGGVRLSTGFVWRPFVSMEVGWTRQSFTDLRAAGADDGADEEGALSLDADAFATRLNTGVQWCGGDSWSVGFATTVSWHPWEATWSMQAGLTAAWSWYP